MPPRRLDATHNPDPPAQPPHASDLVGRTLPSGVRVLASLGETPEGCLYSAQSPTGLEVALLIPPPEYRRTPSGGSELVGRVRQRIRQERICQIMQIKHPNVIEVYETGETSDGSFYILLERPAGELLSTILAARGPRPVQEAVELCLQASAGLQAAHGLGIVHGNVSAQTILVARTADGRPRLKLTGFSLGTSLPGEGPEQSASATYASPEQQCGVAADERSDVFSLGALLHHLLSGAPPESGSVADSIPQIARAVLTEALAEVPAERFQSISAFASALERAAGASSRPKEIWAGRTLLRGTAGVAGSILRTARAMVTKALAQVSAQRFQSISASAGRRLLLGTAGTALIGAAGIGLIWSSHRQVAGGDTQSSVQETGRVVLGDRDSALRHTATMPAGRPPHLGRVSTAVPPGHTGFRGVDTGGSSTPALRLSFRQPLGLHSDSAPQPLISPYRRSHPWAAPPGGRVYYRSSCGVALEFTDMLFFTSEHEARASGFVPTRVPGCH
jgi:serine/threonine protein kinase